MKERRAGPIIAAMLVAIPLLLFASYMGSYYAMLEGRDTLPPPASFWWQNENYTTEYIPKYRLENELIENSFSPANQLDRLIRPGYWK